MATMSHEKRERDPLADLVDVNRVILFHAASDDGTEQLHSAFVLVIFFCFLSKATHVTLLSKVNILWPTTFNMSHTGVLGDQPVGVHLVL
jgi:hypothetical protein